MRADRNQSERWLAAELFKLGQQVSSYVVRMLGADVEKAEPPTADEKWQLGQRMIEMGQKLQTTTIEHPTNSETSNLPDSVCASSKTGAHAGREYEDGIFCIHCNQRLPWGFDCT
jgi:hypothetical protein